MNADKIKSALAEVHVLECQYGRKVAYKMALGSHMLTEAEKNVLANALNLTSKER